MKRVPIAGWLALAILILLLAASGPPLLAQNPQPGSAGADGYALDWYSVDGGGVLRFSGQPPMVSTA